MASTVTYNRISSWSDKLQAHGRYSFGLNEVKESHSDLSEDAVKSSLKRLSAKGKILSVFKGYYLIIPPQYQNKGILPPHLFVDALMRHLKRPYYVSLLNAASFHGASHQQPQEYFVTTTFPVLRPTLKKGLKINYISIKEIPTSLIEKRKTEAGYLNISSPVLTAGDLIQFEKRVGGLNRVVTVLAELSEVINPEDFTPQLVHYVNVSTLQRMGYLLETACNRLELADALFESMMREELSLFRVPLKASRKTKGYSSENRWNVIVNTEIEVEE